MPRLARPRRNGQHAKGKARPRAWHRSLSSSRRYAAILARLARAEAQGPAA